jgi:drug/metabolite transporter (DMT)-like permease
MTIRIVSTPGQISFVTLALVGAMGGGLVVGALTDPALGGLSGTAVTVAAVALAARWFRSEDEPRSEPRHWWRMTASAAASGVWAALFAIGGVVNLAAGSVGVVSGLVSFIIAIAYLNSAFRTHALRLGADAR